MLIRLKICPAQEAISPACEHSLCMIKIHFTRLRNLLVISLYAPDNSSRHHPNSQTFFWQWLMLIGWRHRENKKDWKAVSKPASVLRPVHHAWQCLPSLGLCLVQTLSSLEPEYLLDSWLPALTLHELFFLHRVLAPFIIPQLSQPPSPFAISISTGSLSFLCIFFFVFTFSYSYMCPSPNYNSGTSPIIQPPFISSSNRAYLVLSKPEAN